MINKIKCVKWFLSAAAIGIIFPLNFVKAEINVSANDAVQPWLEKLIQYEDRRYFDFAFFESMVLGSEEQAQLAVQALGRIQDPNSVRLLDVALMRSERSVRLAGIRALGKLGTKEATQKLIHHNSEKLESIERAELFHALGFLQNSSGLEYLVQYLPRYSDPKILAMGARGLGMGLTWTNPQFKLPDSFLDWSFVQVVQALQSRDFAFLLNRYRGSFESVSKSQNLIQIHDKIVDPEAYAIFIRVLAKAYPYLSAAQQDQVKDHLFRTVHKNRIVNTRVEAIRALATVKVADSDIPIVRNLIWSRQASVVTQLMKTIQAWVEASDNKKLLGKLFPTIKNRYLLSRDPWVRLQALLTMSTLQSQQTEELALKQLRSSSSLALRVAATEIVGKLVPLGRYPLVAYLSLVQDAQIQVASAAVQAMGEWPQAWGDRFEVVQALKYAIHRRDEALSSIAAKVAQDFNLKQLVPAVVNVLPHLELEGLTICLEALGQLGAKEFAPIVKKYTDHPLKQVVEQAVKTYQTLTGVSLEERIPLNNRVREKSPEWKGIAQAVKAQVVVTTTRGRFIMEMEPQAPVTAYRIVMLAAAGKYDGLVFHRVIPGFVAQGGDPRGDGYGGHGFIQRDEVSLDHLHERGTVGIATAGKDTGGGQFFVNLAPNLHLHGHYTRFARVISGIKVVERLRQGDRILHTRVQF